MQHAQQATQTVVGENADLTARVRELCQQLANERAQLCHMTSDKVELAQRLHVSAQNYVSVLKYFFF